MYTQKQLDALKKRVDEQKLHCMDPFKPASRPSPQQLEVLMECSLDFVYLVAGNQFGKSQIGARILAWKFEENHPYWERPNSQVCYDKRCGSHNIELVDSDLDEYRCKECGNTWIDWAQEPLTLILAGRVMKQITELWDKKIRPYLGKEGVDFKVVKAGGSLDHVLNLKNGNKIIFLTHDKADHAREKAQSFTAHHVWLDEMPSSHKYVEELQRRVDARRGQFISTFTPKSPNPVIRQMVDNVDPLIGKKFKFGKLDNPIYRNVKEKEIAKVANLPEAERNCILYGDWLDSSDAVFRFGDHNIINTPDNYDKQWPHTLAADPAAGGKGGFILIAQNPHTGRPYIADAFYLKVEGDLTTYVSKISRILNTHNIVRKVYDPSETWFQNEMIRNKIYGWMQADKTDKTALIMHLQKELESDKIDIDSELVELLTELNDAEWDPNPAKFGHIKNSTKYHLCDALQYGIFHLPKVDVVPQHMTRDARLFMASELEEEARAAKRKGNKGKYTMLMRKSRKIW